MAYSCGDARNRATLTSFNDLKIRYLGTWLMHLGISETPTSTENFKWRWLRMKLESSLRSMKKGFTTSTSKRSSFSTTVNLCEGLKGGKNLLSWCLLLHHGSTVLVGPWPPSRPSSSHLFSRTYPLVCDTHPPHVLPHVAIHISFFNPFPRPCRSRRSDQFLPLLGS